MKFYWDVLMIVLAIYNAISLPMRMAFHQIEELYDDNISLEMIEDSVDILFAFDIAILFMTSYIDTRNGETIRQPKIIARHYLTAGFIPDFISTLPLLLTPIVNAATETGSTTQDSLLSLVQLFKLVKLLRVRKLNTLIQNLQ